MNLTSPCTNRHAPRWAAERPSVGKLAEELVMRWASRLSCLPHVCLGSATADRLGMLAYHRIVDPVPGVPKPLHNVTPRRFREQIEGLLRRDWQFCSLHRMLQWKREGRSVPPRTAVVTFDDAFESVYHFAWPVLRELKVPFTAFVCTQYLDRSEPFPFDVWGLDYQARVPAETYRPLTSAQCREMLESGLMELGAHTHTHEDFRGRAEEFRRDLTRCVEILHEQFGISECSFAYPYGSPRLGFASAELQAAARSVGVVCGLTTQAVLVDPSSDPYSWGRFNVFPWDTATTLAAKLGGWYSWSNLLRQWCSLTDSGSTLMCQKGVSA